MVKSLAAVFRATRGSLYRASAVFAVDSTPDNSLLSLSSISCAFSETTGCVEVLRPAGVRHPCRYSVSCG